MLNFRNRRLAGVTMLGLGLAFAACGDDPVVVDPEPEVATMRLTIGGQVIDVTSTGTVTGGPIALTGTEALTVAWLKADGSAETLVNSTEFQINVEPTNTALVTFSRTAAFTGNLLKVANGSTTIAFSLFHVIEGHADFGPFNVSITVS